MCATGQDGVQPLSPPDGSVIGDKVRLQGYTGIILCCSSSFVLSHHPITGSAEV